MASVVVAGGSVAGVGARRLPSRISRSDKTKRTRELKEHREVKTVPEAGGESGGGVQY
jgi:hypothetical protein